MRNEIFKKLNILFEFYLGFRAWTEELKNSESKDFFLICVLL